MTRIDNFLRHSRLLSGNIQQWERIRNTPAWYRDCFMSLEHFKDRETGWEINEYLLSEACRLQEPGQHYFLSLLVDSGGGQELEADFGAGQYLRPNEPGSMVFGDEKTVKRLHGIGPYHSIALYVRQEDFRSHAQQLVQGEMPSLEPLLAKCIKDPTLEVLMRRLMESFRTPDDLRYERKDIQDDIMTRLLTLAQAKTPAVNADDVLRPDSIQRVIDFMHQHPDRDLKRDELAAIAGVVPGHFTRLFRQTVGETPKRYHLKLRIEHISRLLQKSNCELSISALANRCGFGSPSHFSQEFKRQIGIGPDAYRAHFLRNV